MMKRVSAILLGVLMICLPLSACKKDDDDTRSNYAGDATTPYEQTVSFTKGVINTPGMFPAGQTYENNPYTNYVKEQLNIETKVAWEVNGDVYNQKIALSIANGNIPDVLVVDRNLFNQLKENDLIQDMTDAYNNYISPFLKEQYDSFNGIPFEEVMVNGRMMGLPYPIGHGGHNVLWMRKDWLDAVGMKEPSTLDEIINIARAFISKDPGGNGVGKTVGLSCNANVYSGYNSRMGFDTIFSSMGAYPGNWLLKDGKPIYGSCAPEMKPALQLLADLYKEGVLDKEFALRRGNDNDAMLSSGRLGMHFGVWWPAGGVTSAFENNPDAEWTAVSAPVNSAGKLAIPENDPIKGIVVVRKGYKHPEAIVKALNSQFEIIRGHGEAGAAAYAKQHKEFPPWNAMPIEIDISFNNALERVYEDFQNALKANDASVMKTPGYASAFESVQRYLARPNADWADVQTYQARIVGTKAAVAAGNIQYIPVSFYGQTKTMYNKWSTLSKLEVETLVQIVMGEKPVSYFDSFVSQWHSSGGQDILNEIVAYRTERGIN